MIKNLEEATKRLIDELNEPYEGPLLSSSGKLLSDICHSFTFMPLSGIKRKMVVFITNLPEYFRHPIHDE